MANPTGIRALLYNLYRQLQLTIEAYRQSRKKALREKERLQARAARLNAAKPAEPHPGPPLEVGNELMIIDEIVKLYNNLSNSLGRVVIIDQIAVEEEEAIRASAFGIQVIVDMEVAWQMREAFLQREQAWSAKTSS